MKARPLPPGGTIGAVAPASPWDERSDIERGVRWWESKGYRVKLAEGVWERDDYVAGDPAQRARDIETMFADPEVDVVQVIGGGYGCSEVVPHLDLDVVARNAKPFVGYSDITVLHTAFRQHSGLVSFYGPGLQGVGSSERGDWSKDRLLRALTDPTPLGEIPCNPDDDFVGAIGSGRASGRLAGGCLWLLRETLGTPWQIDLAGCVLFFEDVNCPPWHVDGMLVQLRNAGRLDGVVAIAIGEFATSKHWREEEPWLRGRSLEDVFERYLEPLGVPVVFNLPLGHGKHLCTLPLGVQATVDADSRSLTIDEPALEA
ncbi:MAG TPA: LD-carboxypeptidase [Gaiellaceae bacterium]|nr:LD-carboxypeptidase [Gaiellaceae bacterium]